MRLQNRPVKSGRCFVLGQVRTVSAIDRTTAQTVWPSTLPGRSFTRPLDIPGRKCPIAAWVLTKPFHVLVTVKVPSGCAETLIQNAGPL